MLWVAVFSNEKLEPAENMKHNDISWHNVFFSFGIFYYAIIPLIVYYFFDDLDMPDLNILVESYYSQHRYNIYIFGYSMLLLIFFLLGSNLAGKLKLFHTKEIIFSGRLLTYISLPTTAVLILLGYLSRDIALKDYGSNFGDIVPLLGPMAVLSLCILLVVLNLLNYSNNRRLVRYYLLLLIISVFLMLRTGSRLYGMNVILGIFVFITLYYKKQFNKHKLIIYSFLFCLPIMMSALGALRSGGDLSFASIVFISFGESLFTGIGFSSFMENNNLALFEIPYGYVSSIVNFIPSIIFPNKLEYYFGSDINNYYWSAPLGCTHIYIDLLWNFGILGSLIFITILGYFYGYLSRSRNPWLYSYCCALLPFTFFRNGFIEFNKDLILVGIIYTFILYITSRSFVKKTFE